MNKSNFKLKGGVVVYKNGIKILEKHNTILNSGKEWVAKRMRGEGQDIQYMGIGSSDTATDLTQTALNTEFAREAISTSGGVRTGNTTKYTADFPAGTATGEFKEIGLFDASTGGTLVARLNMNFTKTATDSITIEWDIEVS